MDVQESDSPRKGFETLPNQIPRSAAQDQKPRPRFGSIRQNPQDRKESGLALNLAGLVGGAVPPMVAAPLQAAWGTGAIGAMLAAYVVIALVCTIRLPETATIA